MTGLTCLTDLNGIMLDVTDLTDCSLAVQSYEANLTGGETHLSHAVLFSHKLSLNTSGANKLCALTGIKLDVVDKGTNGDVGDRQGVTGFNIRIGTGVENVTIGNAYGSDYIALLTSLVLKEGDVCGSVRIVLDTDYGCGLVLSALENR